MMIVGKNSDAISATSQNAVSLDSKTVCLVNDVKNFKLKTDYIAPPFTIKGNGTIQILELVDHPAQNSKIGGNAILLQGTKFIAKFQVEEPAQMTTPAGNVPDPMPLHMGFGTFLPTVEPPVKIS